MPSQGRRRNGVTTERIRADVGLAAKMNVRTEIKCRVICDLLVAFTWLFRTRATEAWWHAVSLRVLPGLCPRLGMGWRGAGLGATGHREGAGMLCPQQRRSHPLFSSPLFQRRLLSPTSARIKLSRRASPCRGRSRASRPPTAQSTRSSTTRR